jgi:hypothetical protein
MTDTAPQRSSRQRRRSKRSAKAGLQSPALGRNIFIAMTGLTLLLGAYNVYKMRLAAIIYGSLLTNMPDSEVLYLRGEPEQKSPDGMAWAYSQGAGARMVVKFNEHRDVTAISCTGVADRAFGCPDVWGMELATGQDDLVNRLGPPTSEEYITDGKILHYSDLGLRFTMKKYQIAGITKVRRSGFLSYIPRAAWSYLP